MKNLLQKRQNRKAGVRNAMCETALQPWFLPKVLSWKIRRMLPNDYWRKMRYYFDDYGCLRCGRKSVPYGVNGFCRVCRELILHRIGFALGRREKTAAKEQYCGERLKRAAYVRKLLHGLV